MRRIIWIVIIAAIATFFGLYVWAPAEWGIRASIDGAALWIAGIAGGALGSLYNSVVTSPFWQTTIAPWDWLISGIIFSIVTMIIFWKAPSIRQKVTKAPKEYRGPPTGGQVISQTSSPPVQKEVATKTEPTPTPETTASTEGET